MGNNGQWRNSYQGVCSAYSDHSHGSRLWAVTRHRKETEGKLMRRNKETITERLIGAGTLFVLVGILTGIVFIAVR